MWDTNQFMEHCWGSLFFNFDPDVGGQQGFRAPAVDYDPDDGLGKERKLWLAVIFQAIIDSLIDPN